MREPLKESLLALGIPPGIERPGPRLLSSYVRRYRVKAIGATNATPKNNTTSHLGVSIIASPPSLFTLTPTPPGGVLTPTESLARPTRVPHHTSSFSEHPAAARRRWASCGPASGSRDHRKPFLRAGSFGTLLKHRRGLRPYPTSGPRRGPRGPVRSGRRSPARSRRSPPRTARSYRGKLRSARGLRSGHARGQAPSRIGVRRWPIPRATYPLPSPSLSCLAVDASSSRVRLHHEASRGRCRWRPAPRAVRPPRGVPGSCKYSWRGKAPAPKDLLL